MKRYRRQRPTAVNGGRRKKILSHVTGVLGAPKGFVLFYHDHAANAGILFPGLNVYPTQSPAILPSPCGHYGKHELWLQSSDWKRGTVEASMASAR
ncbi:unnamed protein product [Linum trigynum]|uniref:Uncharacterized protein n=1 Tax=Linum trigynum TaxID=586398 RepID=A0AAV2CCP7_9ROSI